jgi:hypothetical protein
MSLDAKIEQEKLEHEIREYSSQLRKKMNDLTMRMILRTTVLFKDIGVF